MVLAELRYFGCIISFVAAVLVPLFITASLAHEAHLSTTVGLATYFLFEVLLFATFLAVWLKRELRKSERSPAAYTEAHYAPIITEVLLVVFIAYQVAKSFMSYRTTGRWPEGTIILLLVIVFVMFPRVQAWRRRFVHTNKP